MQQITIHRGVPKKMTAKLYKDVSNSTFKSEIRSGPTNDSPFIAAWDISFLTDGKDGELVFELASSVTDPPFGIGFMDIVEFIGGSDEPYVLGGKAHRISVIFEEVVTG